MDINNLIERDSLLYAPNDDKPFTGNVFDFYDSGKKSEDGRYRNGLKNGKWTYWFKNGQKWKEGTYKDGKEDGLWIWWNVNGQKWREETYKDGELISEKCWDEDGNEMECWDENETEPPGPAPPGKVWSPEHGHWHDDDDE